MTGLPAANLVAMSVTWLPLHYGEPQVAIGIAFALLALSLAGIFLAIALQTRRDVPFDVVREHGYRIRPYWFSFLAVAGVVVLATSSFYLPYSRRALRATLVTVTAGQFYWSAFPDSVPAETTVRFDVTSNDVNHGFGIYDPEGHLLGEVQAMPGYHNHLVVTFEKRGVYFFSCLEYCGIGHAHMLRTFKVT